MQGLHLRLRDIGTYLQRVIDNQLPVNHAILGNLQDVFNLLPNLSNPTSSTTSELHAEKEDVRDQNAELARAMSVKTNDQLMSIYLSSLIRAITAFHDLIDNKIQNRQQDAESKKEEDEKDQEIETDKKKEQEGLKTDEEAASASAVSKDKMDESKDKSPKSRENGKKR